MRVGAARRVLCVSALLLVAPLAAVLGSRGARAADALAPVDVVEVSGLMDEINADSVERAIERSSANGAQVLILQMNTKGAVVSRDRMERLLIRIRDSRVPIAIWVGPSGSRAYGLPAQMLAVADVTAMAPGARIGRTGTMITLRNVKSDSGGTVDVTPTFGAGDDALRSGTMGFLEAREQGVLRFATDDRGVPVLKNMLYVLDGRELRGKSIDTVVETTDKSGQVVREATTARFYKLGLVPRLFHTVASPPSAYLLATVGLALLVFEFFTAGIGVAGLVGAACLVLGCSGFGALPMSGFWLGVFIASFVAFAVDVQVGIPRFWTGVGLVLYGASSFGMFRSVDSMTLRPSWITLSVGIIGIALTYIVGMPSMVRTRFATPTIGRDNLVGATGTADGDVNPEGVVLVDGARWRARTNRATPLKSGDSARVVAIDGVTLEIEPVSGGARDYREKRATGSKSAASKGSADK